MWILSPTGGFLSAVQHNTDPSSLVVRSRVQGDLAELSAISHAPITGGKRNTDYPWRVIVPRSIFTAYLGELAQRITYLNFKNEVAKHEIGGVGGKDRALEYSRVWQSLLDLEDLDPNGRHVSKRPYGTSLDW